jgi:hypothetical protein
MRMSRIVSNTSLILVLVGIAAIPVVLYMNEYKKVNAPNQEKVLNRVRELMILPEDEEPTFATIQDETKLGPQEIFRQAKNGDVLLVFANAKKAILYRPSDNKIVDVSPVTDNNAKQATASAQTGALAQNAGGTPVPVTVAVYNGTTTAGVAARMEPRIEDSVPGAEVIEKTNAENDYPKTIVVAVKPEATAAAQRLAAALAATVASLPEGEATPEADLLVIAGRDAVASPTAAASATGVPSPSKATTAPTGTVAPTGR